jgi:Flp pilus assembly pilin Flp
MLSIFRTLMSDQQGATAIEHTLIAAFLSLAAIQVMMLVGGDVSSV